MALKRLVVILLAASLASSGWCANIAAPKVSLVPAGASLAGAAVPSVTLRTVPGISAGLTPSFAGSLPGIGTLRPEVHATGLTPALSLPVSMPAAAYRTRAVRQDGRRIILPNSGKPLDALREKGGEEGSRDIGGQLSGLFDGTGKTEALSLDAVDTGSDGREVSPGLSMEAADGLEAEVRRLQDEVRPMVPVLVESISKRERGGRPAALEDQVCRYATEALGLMLRARGIDAHAADAEFHNYLVVKTEKGDVIIDPSIRQFFRKRAHGDIPKVFVGSSEQLHRLFRVHQSAKKTKYEPHRIYFREAVINDSIIEQARAVALRVDGRMRGGAHRGGLLDAQEAEDLDAYAPIVEWLRRNGGERARPAEERSIIVSGSEASGRSGGIILP